MDLSLYEKTFFSQSGEDGITMKLIDLLYEGNNQNKYYVEFGAENGIEGNTRILRDIYRWNGLLMDGGHQNDRINLQKEFITKENVVGLFKKYNVPPRIHVLSVDIDYNDFYCLKEILENYQCDILICEYNATHLPTEDKIVVYDSHKTWEGTNYFGVSLLSLYKLGKKYGYELVYCNQFGVNCFLVRKELIVEKNLNFMNMGDVEKIYKLPKYGKGPNGGHPQDPLDRPYVSFEEAILL